MRWLRSRPFRSGSSSSAAPKGTLPHRTLGWVWVVLMAVVALSSLFIHTIRMVGPFSLIHLLSLLVIVTLPLAGAACTSSSGCRNIGR